MSCYLLYSAYSILLGSGVGEWNNINRSRIHRTRDRLRKLRDAVQINLGRFHAGMPQQFLNLRDARAVG